MISPKKEQSVNKTYGPETLLYSMYVLAFLYLITFETVISGREAPSLGKLKEWYRRCFI